MRAALLPIVLALALFASAMALVVSQYLVRQRFGALEVAQQEGRALESEGARLRSERGRLAQPATVEAAARRLGLVPISPDHVVMLDPPVQAPAPTAAAGAR
jgi:cell division protein FtsL